MATYKLKEIKFNGRDVRVVMQNENGPCPLLAIANVLLLRGVLVIPSNPPSISEDRLMQMVAEYLLDNTRVDDNVPHAANLRKNLDDVLSVLPKLATGVDVNPSFDSVRGFEFTDEIAIFDLFGVGLVHGWVVDPQTENEDLRAFTYNQLVGRLVAILGSETPVHLLTTHSSITSRMESMKKERGPDNLANETPLIDLDSADLEPSSENMDTNTHEVTPEDSPATSEPEDGSTIVKNTVDGILRRVESSFQEEKVFASLASDRPQATSQKETAAAGGVRENPPAASSNSEDSSQNFSIRAKEWLQETSSQLTSYGLQLLLQEVKDEQLVVFFRNNHFNTVYKKANILYILVTDQGYLSEPNVVWEKLDAVDGDTQMMTENFVVFGRPEYTSANDADSDLQKALSASMVNSEPGNNPGRAAFDGNLCSLPDDFLGGNTIHSPVPSADADLALAMQLQAEEEREAAIRMSQESTARERTQHPERYRVGVHQNPQASRPPPPRYGTHQSGAPKPFFQKVSESFKQLFGNKK